MSCGLPRWLFFSRMPYLAQIVSAKGATRLCCPMAYQNTYDTLLIDQAGLDKFRAAVKAELGASIVSEASEKLRTKLKVRFSGPKAESMVVAAGGAITVSRRQHLRRKPAH